MSRQVAAALCSLILGFMASSSLGIAEQKTAKLVGTVGAAASKASKDRPIHTTIKDLMQSMIDPSADVLWNAAGTVVDKEGIHELLPRTPEEWADVRHAAVRIVEGSNLLMMPGRDAAPAGDKSEAEGVELEPPQITALVKKNRKSFDSFARALQDLGAEAMRASDAKDVMLLMDIGARMEGVCEGCHQTFWYPPEKPASARK